MLKRHNSLQEDAKVYTVRKAISQISGRQIHLVLLKTKVSFLVRKSLDHKWLQPASTFGKHQYLLVLCLQDLLLATTRDGVTSREALQSAYSSFLCITHTQSLPHLRKNPQRRLLEHLPLDYISNLSRSCLSTGSVIGMEKNSQKSLY